MVLGVAGFLLIVSERAALCPQLLVPTTDSVPLVNAAPMVNEMLLVPCPDEIVVLAGAVQV